MLDYASEGSWNATSSSWHRFCHHPAIDRHLNSRGWHASECSSFILFWTSCSDVLYGPFLSHDSHGGNPIKIYKNHPSHFIDPFRILVLWFLRKNPCRGVASTIAQGLGEGSLWDSRCSTWDGPGKNGFRKAVNFLVERAIFWRSNGKNPDNQGLIWESQRVETSRKPQQVEPRTRRLYTADPWVIKCPHWTSPNH